MRLSVVPGKEDAYRREGLAGDFLIDLDGVGDEERLMSCLSFLLLKPEALIEHRGRDVLEWVGRRGYTPLAVFPVEVGPRVLRSLWRFQWRIFPPARIAIMLAFYASARVAVVPLWRSRSAPVPGVPFAVDLAAEKGLGVGETGDSDTLRGLLGRRNLMLNYVHAPDEPADVARELALLLAPAQRRQVVEEIRAVAHSETSERVRVAVEAATPALRDDLSLRNVASAWAEDARRRILSRDSRRLDDLLAAHPAEWTSAEVLNLSRRLVAPDAGRSAARYVQPVLLSYLEVLEVAGGVPVYGRVSGREWMGADGQVTG